MVFQNIKDLFVWCRGTLTMEDKGDLLKAINQARLITSLNIFVRDMNV